MSETSLEELLKRGRDCLASLRLADALPLFELALQQDPSCVPALAGLGETLFAQEQYERAVAVFSQAIELQPDEAQLYLWRGKSHFENNDNDAAIEDCEKALELRPGFAEAACFRAAAILCEGEPNLALDEFDAVLALDPSLAAGYFFRGRAFADVGWDEEALADFNRALQLAPTYSYPYYWRAQVWRRLDEDERAMADEDEYLRLRPNGSGYHSRAHAWQAREEYEKALADFAEAIRLEPRVARHYGCRSNIWDILGNDEQAFWDSEKARMIQEGIEDENMNATLEQRMLVYNLIQEHFGAAPLETIQVTERNFPVRVAADLQMGLNSLGDKGHRVVHFWPIHQGGSSPYSFTQLYNRDRRNPPTPVPPQYIEIDVGEDQPVRCLKFGLWLLESQGVKYLALLDTEHHQSIHFQVAALQGEEGQQVTQRFFRHLEDTVQKGACYRGKVLSLEYQEMYSGQSYGILVHKLRTVQRDQVILPPATLALLDRNVVQFVKQRPQLTRLGLATKKGLLFYGPPGTGKTHTIHYLARSMPGQTTFLISAEQVSMLGEYMTLARLFQPSMVVIEDVDLIARDRTTMHSAGEEVLLNKLLNEMDGLKPETDILFVLTTNRPEKLEEALASRPGRIDQAIEFPLPDEEGRAKLVRLYSRQVEVPEPVVQAVVKKTDRVSASFIKELMRRATQFYLEREGSGPLELSDVENALEEMLFRGGSLNRVLLGAGGYETDNQE